MPRTITSGTSLATLKKEAKRWLKALRAHDGDARDRLARAYPAAPDAPTLRDVQHALAREYEMDGWLALTQALERRTPTRPERPLLEMDAYESLAGDYVRAFDERDEAALGRLNQHYARSFTFDDLWAEIWRRVYAFRQRSSRVPANYLQLDEARTLLAQDTGFGGWTALAAAVGSGAPAVAAFGIDAAENRIAPRRHLGDREWDALIGVMQEQRITGLDAGGLMTDDILAALAPLEHVTSLSLGGSRQLTDDGLLHLARMPQLEHLDLSEYPGGRLTDRGLEVLRHLPNLRTFEMTWQSGISDAGVANLRFCTRLERVNLMECNGITDAGLPFLAALPRLREVSLDSLPGVTLEGTRIFPAGVRVKYST